MVQKLDSPHHSVLVLAAHCLHLALAEGLHLLHLVLEPPHPHLVLEPPHLRLVLELQPLLHSVQVNLLRARAPSQQALAVQLQ